MRTKSRRTIFRRLFKPAWLYLLSRSLEPLSNNFGSNRGEPIDRYYMEKFLSENAPYIRGACLEVEDDRYISKFGKNVTKKDIIDINKNNNKANIHADLKNMTQIKDNTYDCIILTHVLSFIDNPELALKECRRILKTNGTILATLPVTGRMDGRDPESDFWSFKIASAKYIFHKYFFDDKLEIKSFGNVLSGLGHWIGMAQEELSKKELDFHDSRFPILIAIRAIK